MERFLKHIGKEELGTLIIDEAGQATPYSALGVLWRAKKAIIVGDPLHVEPVVTVPKELSRRFADEFERLRFQKKKYMIELGGMMMTRRKGPV